MDFESDYKYIMPTYARFPLELVEGKGAIVADGDGNRYIDFGSGIGVNSLGYCDEQWVRAVCGQAARLQHTSNLYYTQPQQQLSQRLCALTGYSSMFFGNSGAEANECAIKLARKYSFDKYGEGRSKVLTLVNSFHGRTVTTLSATGQENFHQYFFPFTGGFDYVEAGNTEQLKEKLDGTVCAVMFEFIQGEGGVVPLEPDFVEQIFALCDENDIITIADEVQTGMGRTGTLLASELYGVCPDITTLAKGLGGGLPIGACLASQKLDGVLGAGTHGSTFGANPVVCAGANAVMERLSQKDFLDEVAQKGDWLASCVMELPHVLSVTGAGLMCGVELEGSVSAKEVAQKCLERGLLILTAKAKLRFLPPLTITKSELEKGIDILSEVLSEL